MPYAVIAIIISLGFLASPTDVQSPREPIVYPARLRQPVRSIKWAKAEVTAYSKAETCPDTQCITANGSVAAEGMVACPRTIPFGTTVYIGNNTYICTDRTALRFNGRYDIFMDSYEEALSFGKQTLWVGIE